MIRLGAHHVQVQSGDTLSSIGLAVGVPWTAIETANRGNLLQLVETPPDFTHLSGGYRLDTDPDLLHAGWVLVIPQPEPVVDPPPDPPDPVPVLLGPAKEAISVRTASRLTPEMITAHREAFGYQTRRYEFIGGAWNPRLTDEIGKVPPSATLDFWTGGPNFILPQLVAAVEADGGQASDIVISFAFPLGLRGIAPPKDAAKAKKVREQLVDVAANRHRWGQRNDLTDTMPYINSAGANDQVYRAAETIADAAVKHGIRVTCRGPWEWFGFNVFVWSPSGYTTTGTVGQVQTSDGIVTSTGLPITTEMGAHWNRNGAWSEFIDAFAHQVGIFSEFGIPTSICGDKQALDVMADGPYAGMCVSDIAARECAPIAKASGGASPLGPSEYGIDFYVPQYMSRAAFDVELRPVLEHSIKQAVALDMPFSASECGVGSGREDAGDGVQGDTTLPMDLIFEVLDTFPQTAFGNINLYHPNRNGHSLPKGSKRRQWLFDYFGKPDNVKMPIYDVEL